MPNKLKIRLTRKNTLKKYKQYNTTYVAIVYHPLFLWIAETFYMILYILFVFYSKLLYRYGGRKYEILQNRHYTQKHI